MWPSILASSGDNVELALIAVVATSVGALVFVIRNGKVAKDTREMAADTNTQISEVNKAVNNIAPDEHRLYDKVSHIAGEISFIKQDVSHLSVQMDQHRKFWEEFHTRWGTESHGVSSNNDIAITLREIQNEVGRFHTILESHVSADENEGKEKT